VPFTKFYVRNGFTYGGTNIEYNPEPKPNNIIPNYSIIREEIQIQYTTFDGNGTLFYDNRDEYVLPGTGDKYIKFTKTGVFT
jgi:outer membrane protein assembly factor BamA